MRTGVKPAPEPHRPFGLVPSASPVKGAKERIQVLGVYLQRPTDLHIAPGCSEGHYGKPGEIKVEEPRGNEDKKSTALSQPRKGDLNLPLPSNTTLTSSGSYCFNYNSSTRKSQMGGKKMAEGDTYRTREDRNS